MKPSLHKCEQCDCNATGVFRFCKFCRHKLKSQNLCGQCAQVPPHGKSLYCLPCQAVIQKHCDQWQLRLEKSTFIAANERACREGKKWKDQAYFRYKRHK